MSARRLTPELLDQLPLDAPEAQESRRDLWRLNTLMGHTRFWRHWWHGEFPNTPPRRLAEIGSGDARLAARNLLAAFPAGGQGGEVILVDLQPCHDIATLKALENKGWKIEVVAADIFSWLEHGPTCDAMTANLFLHHFTDEMLVSLFSLAASKTARFCSLEPRRALLSAAACKVLPLVGCNHVTRHDAKVSVEAGFTNAELTALWPSDGWQTKERRLWPFSHVFTATRLDA